MSNTDGLPHAAEAVLTFLENVGKRAETERYLKLFRELPRESFAIIAAEASQLTHTQGVLAGQLRYLKDLGLIAPIVVGLWEPERARQAAVRLELSLIEAGVEARLYSAEGVSALALREAIGAVSVPIIVFDDGATARAQRFARVRELACSLETRKLVFVRERGGLGPHGIPHIVLGPEHVLPCHAGGISVISLRTDLSLLLDGQILSVEDRALLKAIAATLNTSRSLLVSVTSPLGLLRELFTVKGAGTLVKRGSDVVHASDYAGVDEARLRLLLESSFGGRVNAAFFERRPLSVFLESEYRGAAILESSTVAPVLSKFAVDPIAQGEGLGRDLWQAMLRRFDSLIWRARPNNPILPWYVAECDGMMRSEQWVAFWRRVRAEDVPRVISELGARPEDIHRDG